MHSAGLLGPLSTELHFGREQEARQKGPTRTKGRHHVTTEACPRARVVRLGPAVRRHERLRSCSGHPSNLDDSRHLQSPRHGSEPRAALAAIGAACLKRPLARHLQYRPTKGYGGYVRRPFTKGSFCLRCIGTAQMSSECMPACIMCAQAMRGPVTSRRLAKCCRTTPSLNCGGSVQCTISSRKKASKRTSISQASRLRALPPSAQVLDTQWKGPPCARQHCPCYGRTLCCSSPFVIQASFAWRQGPGGTTVGGAPGERGRAQLRYLCGLKSFAPQGFQGCEASKKAPAKPCDAAVVLPDGRLKQKRLGTREALARQARNGK